MKEGNRLLCASSLQTRIYDKAKGYLILKLFAPIMLS